MERFLSENGKEISRADTKAAVLLSFTGVLLGAFITVTRIAPPSTTQGASWTTALWWSGVTSAVLAIASLVSAITPRRRGGRAHSSSGPGYFEHIPRHMENDRLHAAFHHLAHDPTAPLLASLRRTSAIVRAKYRWIEAGTTLLLTALPQLTLVLTTL